MITSTVAKLRKAIIEHRSTLTKKDVAKSSAFIAMIVAGINAIFKFHKRKKKVAVNVRYDEMSPVTAYTDDYSVNLNAANPLFCLEKGEEVSLKEYYERILGAIFHEIGHILYTPFMSYKKRLMAFQEGIISSGSIELSSEEKEAYDELALLMKENRMSTVDPESMRRVDIRRFVLAIFQNLFNITEDGRIEKLLLTIDTMFAGFWKGLKTLRAAHFRCMDSMEEYEENIPTFFNLCLAYAKFGDTKKYDGNFECFEKAKPIIDEMINCEVAEEFLDLNTRLLLCAWPMIKAMLQESPESEGASDGEGSEEKSSEKSPGSGSSGESEEGSEESKGGSSSPKTLSEEMIEKINAAIKEMEEEMEKSMPSEMPEGNEDPKETPPESSGGTSSGPASGSGSSAEHAFDTLRDEIAEEKAREEIKAAADAETKVMTENACAPKGYRSTVHTENEPPYNADSVIREIEETTGKAIEKAAREIKRHFETDMRTGSSRHRITGSRFHAEDLVYNDFKCFESRSIQKDVPDMAVGLVIDESGSMSWNDRDEAARAAAICLYELFEKIPRMDIAIFGHSADMGYSSGVDIFPYVDFGIKEKDALKKLTAIHARCNNLDVIPIKLMAEKLLKQPVGMRMMIIVSDGLPAAHGYGGENACQELKETAEYYSRQGIEIIAAAIGDDKERIKEIYKGQRFLDISDLSSLPMELVSVIKRKL